MKLRGNTNTDDWHPMTFLSMMLDRRCWNCGVTLKEWRLRWTYTWYDGPIWQLEVGPFWVALLNYIP